MTDPQNRQPRPDIADVELTVEQLRREGLCIFRSDDKRHWTAKEDAGPLATVGGFHTRSGEAFGGYAPMHFADLFCAAPALLRALELLVDAIDEMQIAAATGNLNLVTDKMRAVLPLRTKARAAIEAARKHQRQGERMRDSLAAAVSDSKTGV